MNINKENVLAAITLGLSAEEKTEFIGHFNNPRVRRILQSDENAFGAMFGSTMLRSVDEDSRKFISKITIHVEMILCYGTIAKGGVPLHDVALCVAQEGGSDMLAYAILILCVECGTLAYNAARGLCIYRREAIATQRAWVQDMEQHVAKAANRPAQDLFAPDHVARYETNMIDDVLHKIGEALFKGFVEHAPPDFSDAKPWSKVQASATKCWAVSGESVDEAPDGPSIDTPQTQTQHSKRF